MEWLHIPFNRNSTGRRVQEIAESPIRRDEMGMYQNLKSPVFRVTVHVIY